ncbi:MAG TPA: class II aldolase/adducin family protein [Syntrophomonadaceae bacterium]|nr:class II aldolase/adducin family protein [Syntrophomonadaceae bacterium]
MMKYEAERRALIQTALEIYESQLVVGTWGNVSLRLPAEEAMLITPSGMDYKVLDIEDPVQVSLDGSRIQGRWKPSIETPLHRRIYLAMPEVGAICHVHSPYASAYAVAGQAVPVVLEETAQVVGHAIEVAPYARCGSEELAEGTMQFLKGKRAVLLANHGLVAAGKDLADALKICYIVEKTARVSIMARLLGQVRELSKEDINALQHDFTFYGQSKDHT